MTIKDFLRTTWEGRYYVMGAVVVVLATTLFYLGRQDPTYRATAVVDLVTVQAVRDEEIVDLAAPVEPADVGSVAVADAAAAELGLDEAPAWLAGSVTATMGSDGTSVRISATAGDPDTAQELTNAVAVAYADHIDTSLADYLGRIDARRADLASQVTRVRASLLVDPGDPLARVELEALVAEHAILTAMVDPLRTLEPAAVVEQPAISATEEGAQPWSTLGLAVLAGLIAGVGLAFGRRAFDQRIRRTPEATTVASAPVLALLYGVPAASKDFRRTGSLPVATRAATPFTESIRELRTAIQQSSLHRDDVVVVVTAADPYALRSFITANLAASFALSGQRTIVVSADLRRPEIDQLLPPPAGWTGGDHELRRTKIPSLQVMPTLDPDMDPADYFATRDARNLFGELRSSGDVIVIDAPPVLAAADATILGRYADGVVLVAAAGKTSRDTLSEAADRLRDNGVNLIGVAMAGLTSDRRTRYASTYGSHGLDVGDRVVPRETGGDPEHDGGRDRSDEVAASTVATDDARA